MVSTSSRNIFLFFILILPAIAWAQTAHNQDDYFLKVFKADAEIKLDGEANEDVWKTAVPIGDFWQKFPTSDRKSDTKTIVRSAYDAQNLYFFIQAFDSTNNYVATSLKRDGSMRLDDGVGIILDPVNKQSNGFGFTVSPNNVQAEFQFGNRVGRRELSKAWDNKWFSAVKRTAEGYSIEVAIPFKTLRYSADNTSWGVNFIRSNRKDNEFSTWTNVPVQFNGTDLGYLGTLQFDGDLVEQKRNISIIPYVTGSVNSDIENGDPTSAKANAGFDAKVAVSPSLNLDLTFNPDFSQVEVDEQVTNLTRFSIFFPERRTFFLENSDIFSDYGGFSARPFFSRSIGLDKDGNTIPILYGARLSGNLTEKTRIGVMNMQTLEKGDFAAQNYTAASVHQRFGARSTIKGYFLNRSATGVENDEAIDPFDKYGRNAGIELRLSDISGSNQFWTGYHTSWKEGIEDKNNFYKVGYRHASEKFEGFVDWGQYGKNYYADMGFTNRHETYAQTGPSYDDPDTTIRAGFSQIFNRFSYTIRPKERKLLSLQFSLFNAFFLYEDGSLSDRRHTLGSEMRFQNSSSFEVKLNIHEDNLLYYFPLPENKPLEPGNYKYTNLELEYKGDARKNLSLEAGLILGQYYNAQIRQYNLSVLFRTPPKFSATINAQFNDLLFPDEYGRTKFWLIGPKIEATFTNNFFWTTFLQFNTQRNNFNINSRFQYRYSPMSDIFLVYTDNYYSDPFMTNKNRAIVLKVNYWLNL